MRLGAAAGWGARRGEAGVRLVSHVGIKGALGEMGGNDRGESYLDSGGVLLMDSAGSHSLPAAFSQSVLLFLSCMLLQCVCVFFCLFFFTPGRFVHRLGCVDANSCCVDTKNR